MTEKKLKLIGWSFSLAALFLFMYYGNKGQLHTIHWILAIPAALYVIIYGTEPSK